MKTIEYKTVDKSDWQRGEWDNEPDKVQFMDEATGLPCLIVRGPVGGLCGYVGVLEGHPAYRKDYGWEGIDADVHGGLTFASACQPGAEDHSICHIPGEGESDAVWWLGFDCGHSGDLMPGMPARYSFGGDGTYRNIAYVKSEIASLATQLKAMQP